MAITVLLVDDERTFVETLSKRLALRRLQVLTAFSAAEALRVLAERAVDVVVLDVRMPDMDGIATTRAIRETYPLVEVILLTGHASLEASLEGMSLGAFDYLLKPVAIDELMFKIEDAHQKKTLQEDKIRRLAEQAGTTGPGPE